MTIITYSGALNDNITGLRLLTESDCGCPGRNISYACVVTGGLITVWNGSAFFDCVGNRISLRHNQFEEAMGTCNTGSISGYGVNNVNDVFKSRIDVNLSLQLNERTVTCSIDDGTSIVHVGTRELMVTTGNLDICHLCRISIILIALRAA